MFLERVRPEVDVDAWFVRGAAGRYALDQRGLLPWGTKKRRATRLAVERAGDELRVRREVLLGDVVVAHGEGTAVQEGKKLRATFTTREGDHPERFVWTLERDGTLSGRSGLLRERGRRVE